MVETMLGNGYLETKKLNFWLKLNATEELQEYAKHIARRMLSSKYVLHIVNQLLDSALCDVKNYVDLGGCFISTFDNIIDSWEWW